MSETGERQEQSGGFEVDLSKVGLLIIVPLGFWAYYTTFRGMVLLTRGEQTGQVEVIFGTIGALIGAAAILVLLALTSWILGSDLAASFSNQRRPDSSTRRSLALMISAFLFFLILSVFFSYTYYHNNFFHLTSEAQLAVNQPSEINNRFMEPLRETLKKNDVTEGEKIRNADKAWSASLSELIRLAGESRDSFRQEIDTLRKKSAAQQAEIRAKARAAERQLEKNRKRLAEIKVQIDRIDTIIKPDQEEIERLKTEEEEFRREADAEEKGVGKTKKVTCGQECQRFRKLAAGARKQREKYEGLIKPRLNERARLEAERTKLNSQVDELQKDIDAEKALDPASTSGEFSGAFLDSILLALRTAHDSPTWANINAARPRCEELLGVIRQGKVSAKISPEFNCLPTQQAATTLLDSRDKVMAGRTAFDMECSDTVIRSKMLDISRQVELKKIEPRDSLQRAREVVQNCVSLAIPAGLSGAQEGEILRQIADYTRRNPLAVNVFDRARNALFDFDGDARIAMSIAFAQDMLILVFRFVAENYRYRSRRRRDVELGRPIDVSDDVGDDPQIRAWKALLRLARPGGSDTSRVSEADVAAQGFDQTVLANFNATLNSIGIQGAAWSDRKGVIVIENSAIRAIDRELRAIEGQAIADGDQASETGDRLNQQGGDGYRRPSPTGFGQQPQSATEVRPASRSARRGRLRELITGSHEPQSERARPRRQEPVPPQRVRTAQSGQQSADFDSSEPRPKDVRAPDLPIQTPASQTQSGQPDNPFDYLSRFSSSNKKE